MWRRPKEAGWLRKPPMVDIETLPSTVKLSNPPACECGSKVFEVEAKAIREPQVLLRCPFCMCMVWVTGTTTEPYWPPARQEPVPPVPEPAAKAPRRDAGQARIVFAGEGEFGQ